MIFDEVALGLRLRGVAEQDVEKRVLETLKVCGLYEFRKWPISALSFGQKKRVTIASVLVMNPEIILLDEPTAGQDKRNYTEIMNFLNQLNKAGHTIIMITHDMQLMLEYSDRSIVVSNGEIIADCSPVALFNQNTILEKANLKKTSLFELAEKLAVDPIALTHYYIEKREVFMASHLIGYQSGRGFLYQLSGASKLIFFVLVSVACMTTYDTRLIAAIGIASLVLFKIAGIRWQQVSFVVKFIGFFAFLNVVMVYLFAPNYGETIYGTKTILLQGYGRFYLTSQELFYLFNLALKYFCTVPLAVLFLMTTQPSQFASSLNQIGVSYKVAYAVSLTLRYIPNVQEEFYMIRMSQEARGLELSQKEKLMKRIKGNLQIVIPLIFSSLERIDTVSTAMELRRFGKIKSVLGTLIKNSQQRIC